MPKPIDRRSAYFPGLDGIRALAVVAVMAYHFQVPHAGGGLLGVSVFFTLSGFLITSILLASVERTGGLELGRFYLHRARRLLPALGVVLLAVLGMTLVLDRDALAQRWHDTLLAILYVSNWGQIAQGTSYADYFRGPDPLSHLWSLAVEEQFYLLWPLLLLLLWRVMRGDRAKVARATLALALASFALMAFLATPGMDNTRVYEGTDTRAGELLVGAVLALVYRPQRLVVVGSRAIRTGMDALGVAALGVVVWLVVSTTFYSPGLYRGGFALLAGCSAIVVMVTTYPGSALGWVLGRQPLRWVGERSYGIYLWHMPVVAFTPQSLVDAFSTWLLVLHLGLTLLLAALSWTLVEDPIRRRGLVGALRQLVPQRLFGGAAAPPVLAGTVALLIVSVCSVSVAHVLAPDTQPVSASSTLTPAPAPTVRPGDKGLSPRTEAPATPGPSANVTVSKGGKSRTSCTSVAHVGDSTSLGLVSPVTLPKPRTRIEARYRQVGVKNVMTDVSGARATIEHYKGQPNSLDAVKKLRARNADGCWVLALGTNDVANVAVGGVVSVPGRIDALMKAVDGRPTLWLTLRTRLTSGPWSEANMQKFNADLMAACKRYPTMRVYDWASQVQPSWYIGDGIHFTSEGYRQRAKLISRALATAFPADGSPSSRCTVLG